MTCELVCITGKKAMDALKAGDSSRALSLVIKARDMCLIGTCDDGDIFQTLTYAMEELIEDDTETAMKHLRRMFDLCK